MQATAVVDMAPPPTLKARRTVAALDLLHRLPDAAPRRIGALSGGPEAIEALLAGQFPAAEIFPIGYQQDARFSPSPDRPRYRLSHDGGARPREPFDLVFANGALDVLLSLRELAIDLLSLTRPGGLLAFQAPNNLHEPNRQLLRMVAVDGPWATQLAPIAKSRPFNASFEDLDALLRPLCQSVEFWETTYIHRMDGAAEIIETTMETSLAPFLRPLDGQMRRRFLERYAEELSQAYPAQPDGKILLRFPRIFFITRR